jgi:N-acetylmuramoyl-L-alanine amidase
MHQRPSLHLTRADLLRRGALGLLGSVAAGRLLVDGVPAATAAVPAPVIRVHDVSLGARSRELASRSSRFNLLGLHWQGSGSVWFRTGDGDRWRPWQRAVVHELAEGGEGATGDWQLGTPVWLGGSGSTEVEYRVEGDVRALRAHEVWSPVGAAPRQLAIAPTPFIVPRASWGADEAIVRATPSSVDRLLFAVVHHTAGKSPATPAESAALVRGIQRYHVLSNGWNDIGYNFLVDGFGQVFEGRGGGIDRNVIGAHALGFNTGSTGVAVLGNFEKEVPTAELESTLAQLLAWRLDVGHVDPLAAVAAVSTSGASRTLRAISGHRDTGATACPGANLYPLLDGLAEQVAGIGLPKLYDARNEGASSRLVRFTGRLSTPLPWAVSVTGPDGVAVAQGAGAGTAIDWTWDATAVPDGLYTWSMQATGDVLPASGVVRVGVVAAPPASSAQPRPPRPAGVPRRIPSWAWRLRTWHRLPTAQRGPRPPGTPRRPPSWYWPWFRWTGAVERWQRSQRP